MDKKSNIISMFDWLDTRVELNGKPETAKDKHRETVYLYNLNRMNAALDRQLVAKKRKQA